MVCYHVIPTPLGKMHIGPQRAGSIGLTTLIDWLTPVGLPFWDCHQKRAGWVHQPPAMVEPCSNQPPLYTVCVLGWSKGSSASTEIPGKTSKCLTGPAISLDYAVLLDLVIGTRGLWCVTLVWLVPPDPLDPAKLDWRSCPDEFRATFWGLCNLGRWAKLWRAVSKNTTTPRNFKIAGPALEPCIINSEILDLKSSKEEAREPAQQLKAIKKQSFHKRKIINAKKIFIKFKLMLMTNWHTRIANKTP